MAVQKGDTRRPLNEACTLDGTAGFCQKKWDAQNNIVGGIKVEFMGFSQLFKGGRAGVIPGGTRICWESMEWGKIIFT